eukprot:7379572-Prymnesium_polylepis.1
MLEAVHSREKTIGYRCLSTRRALSLSSFLSLRRSKECRTKGRMKPSSEPRFGKAPLYRRFSYDRFSFELA